MDKNHFGDSPAAISLVDILSKPENSKYTRSISALFGKFNHLVNQIDTFNFDSANKVYLLVLIKKEFKNRLFERDLPLIIKTHTFNVFTRNCRLAMKHDMARNDFVRKNVKKK